MKRETETELGFRSPGQLTIGLDDAILCGAVGRGQEIDHN